MVAFWLVGEFTTHFTRDFSGIGMFLGVRDFDPWPDGHECFEPCMSASVPAFPDWSPQKILKAQPFFLHSHPNGDKVGLVGLSKIPLRHSAFQRGFQHSGHIRHPDPAAHPAHSSVSLGLWVAEVPPKPGLLSRDVVLPLLALG